MPNSLPLPSRRRNSPAWVPPVTSMISPTPASTSASIAQLIIGRSLSGSRCLLVILVRGWRRLPVPPASTTPFTPRPSSLRDYGAADGRHPATAAGSVLAGRCLVLDGHRVEAGDLARSPVALERVPVGAEHADTGD